MFPEISHSQALLGALVSVLQKFQFIKLIRRFYINFKMNSAQVRVVGLKTPVPRVI
jgi:hypothetical protein